MGCVVHTTGKVLGTVFLGLAAGSTAATALFGVPAVASAAVRAGQDSVAPVRALYAQIKTYVAGPLLVAASALLTGVYAISRRSSRHPYLLYASAFAAPAAFAAQRWFLVHQGACAATATATASVRAKKDNEEEEVSLLDNSVYARLDADTASDGGLSSDAAPTPPAETAVPLASGPEHAYVQSVANTLLATTATSTAAFIIAVVGIYGDH